MSVVIFELAAGQGKYLGQFWLQGCEPVEFGFRDQWRTRKGALREPIRI
jgi:hypothetical protein